MSMSRVDEQHQEASAKMEELAGIFFEVYGHTPSDWHPARVATAATSYHGWHRWVGQSRTSLTVIRSILEAMAQTDNRRLPTLEEVTRRYKQRVSVPRGDGGGRPRSDEDRCALCDNDGLTYLWQAAGHVIPVSKLSMYPFATYTAVACHCSIGRDVSRQMYGCLPVCSEKHANGYAMSGRQVSQYVLELSRRQTEVPEPNPSEIPESAEEELPF